MLKLSKTQEYILIGIISIALLYLGYIQGQDQRANARDLDKSELTDYTIGTIEREWGSSKDRHTHLVSYTVDGKYYRWGHRIEGGNGKSFIGKKVGVIYLKRDPSVRKIVGLR